MPRFACIAFFAVLALSACGPVYKTDYHLTTPPTQEGKICANNCLDKKAACQATCRADEAECKHIKALEAENAWLRYREERREQGRELKKTKSSFENYSACNSSNCLENCESFHRVCHSNCGGDVVEHTVCTAFCE